MDGHQFRGARIYEGHDVGHMVSSVCRVGLSVVSGGGDKNGSGAGTEARLRDSDEPAQG